MSEFIPKEFTGFDVVAKVCSQKGECTVGYCEGDEVLFSKLGVQGKTCYAALSSILPSVMSLAYGAVFPWSEDPDVSYATCPDGDNPVTFELRRIRK